MLKQLKIIQVLMIIVFIVQLSFAQGSKVMYVFKKDRTVPQFKPEDIDEIKFLDDACIDLEGYVYKTKIIGNQVWMAENLRVTRYRNGELISETWVPTNELDTYGRLYSWNTFTDPRNIAPEGWHVPTNIEWAELANYVTGEGQTGEALKSTDKWARHGGQDCNGTDLFGFNAFPAGWNGGSLGLYAYFWSANEVGPDAYCRTLFNNSNDFRLRTLSKTAGHSVRLVKD